MFIPRFFLLLVVASLIAAATSAFTQVQPENPLAGEVLVGTHGTMSGNRADVVSRPGEDGFTQWWSGSTALSGQGNPLFDFRSAASDRGLNFTGNYRGAFIGVVASQGGQRGFYDQNLDFGCALDFGEFLKSGRLDGLTAFVNARYRDSWSESDANQVVMANPMFAPTSWQSGTQCRLMSFGLEYASGEWLPVPDMVVARAGWLQPQREFLDQPLSKLFLNSAISSLKGIGGNVPFGSSFSTWGGKLELNLTKTFYVSNGLFMSFPQGSSSTNHGLAFQGFAQNPARNGLFYMGETGITPRLGAAKLPGQYAFGGYFYGTPHGQSPTWSGSRADGRYGFYFQADQMLYKKDAKTAANSQGLSSFNLLTFAPGYARQNQYPFYFQSGLVYRGLIPDRRKDATLIALGYGAYQGGVGNPERTYTAVIEGGYRCQINGWAFVQPYFQYISRPNGSSEVSNAAILGVLSGLVF